MRTLALALLTAMMMSGVAYAHCGSCGIEDEAHDHLDQPVEAAAPAAEWDFTLVDSNGQSHTLSSYQGKYVVLEWINFDCPFVKKHYGSGNMPGLQAMYVGKGVVWLGISSSAPGKQGNFQGQALRDRIANENFQGTAYLLDEDGAVGKQYDAKTTPHMLVFNPELDLIYDGAIDSTRSTDPDDIPNSTNYVVEVLEAAMAGLPVPNAKTTPYGCSVKY